MDTNPGRVHVPSDPPSREQALRMLSAELLRQRKLKRTFQGLVVLRGKSALRAKASVMRAWERDARAIRQAATAGHRTVGAVSQATGLRRARVALIVTTKDIAAVTA